MEQQPQNLDTIPPELLAHIGSYLQCPAGASRSQRALSQLTQTCKALRDELQPMLFRTYTHGSQHVSRLVKFLRAIVSRPDLAAAVTSLTFRHPLTSPTSLSLSEKQFIETCITDLGLPALPTDWYSDEPTYRHTVIEAVLAYTPNLQTLELPVNEEWSLNTLEDFPKANRKIEFPLLRDLSIYYYYISGDRWGVDYSQISTLLEISPNLEHLHLPTLEGFYSGRSELPDNFKSLKTLDLGESASGSFFITSLLARCESLRKFSLHWLCSTGYDESHHDWSIVDVWTALATDNNKRTIEEITFESMSDIPLGADALSTSANLVSSLAEFTKLKVLHVDGRSLEAIFQSWTLKTGGVGSIDEFVEQVFPSGITSLAIWSPNYVLIPALLALARAKTRGLYGSLVEVEIGASHVFKDDWMPRAEWSRSKDLIRAEFLRGGVRSMVIEIPDIPPEFLSFPALLGEFLG